MKSEPLSYEELQTQLQDKDLIINNLIQRNRELMEEQVNLTDPEKFLLVVSHDNEKLLEREQILSVIYQAAQDNRLAISDIKGQDGVVKTAICGIYGNPQEDGCLSLFPLFIFEEVKHEDWLFPGPGGKWFSGDEPIEAKLVS